MHSFFVSSVHSDVNDAHRAGTNRLQNKKRKTINWNLADLVETYHGIIVLEHAIDPRQVVLLKERCAELTEGTSAVLLRSSLDEK